MKTQFDIHGLNLSRKRRRLLEQPLERLLKLVSITRAAIVLKRQREETPAFHAFASLAVPGPDIHANARDHTLEAAWLKVTIALRKQIEQRKTRQLPRIKFARHRSVFTAPWARGGVLK